MQADLIILDEPLDMPEQRIDMNMLSRVDSEQKATAVKVDEIGKDLHALDVKVSKIEGAIRPSTEVPWWLRFIVAPVCVAAILGTAGTVIHLEIEVASIKGSQTKQDLSEITTRVTRVQAEGKTPTPQVAQQLTVASRTVVSAIAKYPQYPEVWKAASSLVNVRSLGTREIPEDVAANVGPLIPNQGDCFTVPFPTSQIGSMDSAQNNTIWKVSVPLWHDCTLVLDDLAGFRQSNLAKYIANKVGSAKGVQIILNLTLVRVNIIYHGSAIIPIGQFRVYDSAFSFDVPTAPPQQGRALIEAILSNDLEKPIDLTLPDGL